MRSSYRALATSIVAFIGLALSAGDALGAITTGNVAGLVTGPDGTPLKGATLTLEGPNMIGKRTETSFDDGRYRIIQVPPGTYTLTIEAVGYLTRTVPNVLVSIDRTSTVDLVMQPPESAMQEVTITDSKPTIDVSQTQGGEVMNKEFLTKLPMASDYLNVARMVPGVIGTGNANVQGAAGSENQWLVDGVNITDPVTNTFSANFNFEAIEQMEVLTGGFDPEHQAMGGVFNVVSKSGGNDFHGGVSSEYSDNKGIPVPLTGLFGDTLYLLESPRREHRCARYEKPNGTWTGPTGNDLRDQDHCEEIIEFSERSTQATSSLTNLWLGGPILRDKVWFFSSYEFVQGLRNTYNVNAPRNFTGHYFQSKVTWQPVSRQKVTLSFQADPTYISRVRQSPYVPEVAEADQKQGGQFWALDHLWFLSDRLVLKNTLSLKTQYIDVVPNSGDFSTPGHAGSYGAQNSENYVYYSFNRRNRIQYTPKATYYLDGFYGSHELAVGMDLAYLRERYLAGRPGNIYFIDRLQRPYDETSSTVEYYWVETSGPYRQDSRGLETGAYIQDAWKPTDQLTVRGGFRVDRAGLFNDQNKEVISYWAISPRIYAAYDLTGDGKTVVRGGYGRFIDPGKLSQSDFLNAHGEGYKLYLGDYFYSGSSPGNVAGNYYSGSNGEATTLRAGHVRAPTKDAVRLGAEREVVNGIAMGITWNATWTRYLFEDDDANLIWNSDGTQAIGNRMGVVDTRWRVRTPASARRYYQNVEFTLRRRFAEGLELLGSYTWSRSVGTTPSQYTSSLDTPPQNRYDYGYLPNDAPHVVRLAASYDFPFGLTLGSMVNYVSGSRYERYAWNDFYNGYSNRTQARNTHGAIPGAPIWDLKASYGPKLPGALGRVKGELTINNVLNNRQVTGFQQSPYDDIGVKYPSGRQPPISFRLGGRYEF